MSNSLLPIFITLTAGIVATKAAVVCPVLAPLVNGYVDSGNGLNGTQPANVNDYIYFTCNTNYALSGSVSAMCQSDGTWSAVKPTCNAATGTASTCSDQFSSVSSTGSVSRSGPYYSGNMVNFKCNSGWYFPDGSSSWNYYCDTSQQWSDTTPICAAPPSGDAASGAVVSSQYVPNTPSQYAYCGQISASFPDGITSYGGSYSYMGSVWYQRVTFKCVKGYTLSGATSATCKFGSGYKYTMWSIKTMPTCKNFTWTWQTALIVMGVIVAIVAGGVFCCVKMGCKQRWRPMQTTTVMMMQPQQPMMMMQPQQGMMMQMPPQQQIQTVYPMSQSQNFGPPGGFQSYKMNVPGPVYVAN